MFCPPGYVPLALLWEEFTARKSVEITAFARSNYLDTGLFPKHEFGSPADFVEEVFLRTFDETALALCSLDGDVMTVKSKSPEGSSQIFLRTSVFESSCIAETPHEAGENGQCLLLMGSPRFQPWPVKIGDATLWADRYAKDYDIRNPEDAFEKLPYHTLPFCFERNRFTVPKLLPPWCEDALDVVYIETIFPHLLGRSICLDDSQVHQWRSDNIDGSKFEHLLGVDRLAPVPRGRPPKVQNARKKYDALFPVAHPGSWKQACNDIKEKLGLCLSVKNLQ